MLDFRLKQNHRDTETQRNSKLKTQTHSLTHLLPFTLPPFTLYPSPHREPPPTPPVSEPMHLEFAERARAMKRAMIWRSPAALTMAIGMSLSAALPLLMSVPAMAGESMQLAQLFRRPSQLVGVGAGTVIPSSYTGDERVILTPDETVDLDLTIDRDVYSSRGTIVIRAGSVVRGELRPVEGGTQFVASEIVLAGTDEPREFVATSDVITETQTIDRRTDPDFLRGAVIGAAAAAVLAEVFGSVDFLEVLAGAGLGVLGEVLLRRDREVEVVVVEPNSDLDLLVEEDFVLGYEGPSFTDYRRAAW